MRHVGKFFLVSFALVWSFFSLQPFEDQDVLDTLGKAVEQNQAGFKVLEQKARQAHLDGKASSLLQAFQQVIEGENTDLKTSFFPQLSVVRAPTVEKRNQLIIQHFYEKSQASLKQGLDLQGGAAFVLQINQPEGAKQTLPTEEDLSKVMEVIESRVNALGVAEPIIRPRPPDQLEVQMPGLKLEDNSATIEALIRPARLEFRLVHRYVEPDSQDEVGQTRLLPVDPKQPAQRARYEVLGEVLTDENQQPFEVVRYVKVIPEAYGDIIEEAYPSYDESGQLVIGITMTPEGAKIFRKLSESIYNEDRRTGTRQLFAIVLDGKVESAPGIQSPILNGRAIISGSYTDYEVRELVSALNNPLQLALSIEEKSEVGPTLAADMRAGSIRAVCIAALVVATILLLYYGVAGVVPIISVALALIIVLGVLASLQATLTLPGIAALVLTIGMAVDANILIFERVREELRIGKSLDSSLAGGYSKALSTILDANITTLITAIILLQLGTGAVRGFGITLAIGIVASVFAALVISRLLTELLLATKCFQRLIPKRFEGETHFAFLSAAKTAFVISWLVVLLGLITVFTHQDKLLGIDFKGGAQLSFSFKEAERESLSIQKIQELGDQKNLGELQVSFKRSLATPEYLSVQVEADKAQEVSEVLVQAFPAASLKKVSENLIGASVSERTLHAALKCLGLSLIAILLYVALRFEWGFGVGAVVATIHDLLISIGLYVILGQIFDLGSGQFTAPMVAAALMIVGYSINDTIVVFDRVREELELSPDRPLKDILHLAINRTLSRTLLTSFTTLGAALALFLFGTGIVADFSLMFLIGILTGTFSSIFIATPILYWWHKGQRKRLDQHTPNKPIYQWH